VLQLSPFAESTTIHGAVPLPTGLAADASGSVYVARSSGIDKYSAANDTTPALTFGTSGAGTLSSPGAMAFAPDGLLYVIDSGNDRIASFEDDGDFISAFSLVGPVDSAALAIGSNGWLYTANGSGGGDIYDIYTGTQLGSFESSAIDNSGTPGHAAIAIGGDHLYLYDAATGLHVFAIPTPEPATWSMLLLACGAGIIVHRRTRPLRSNCGNGSLGPD
jgi:hypothetical protein